MSFFLLYFENIVLLYLSLVLLLFFLLSYLSTFDFLIWLFLFLTVLQVTMMVMMTMMMMKTMTYWKSGLVKREKGKRKICNQKLNNNFLNAFLLYFFFNSFLIQFKIKNVYICLSIFFCLEFDLFWDWGTSKNPATPSCKVIIASAFAADTAASAIAGVVAAWTLSNSSIYPHLSTLKINVIVNIVLVVGNEADV